MKPSLRGVELHPVADAGLPFLMLLAVAAAVGALAAAYLVALPPWLGLWAFVAAVESYLFTTLFFVREVDLPAQLRWAEAALMAVLAKWLVTLPVAADAVSALWTGWDQVGVLFALGLLAWAWWFGLRTARLVMPLHPGLVRLEKRNDHGEAYDAIRAYLLGMVGTVGLVVAVADWAQGYRGFWGWTWASAALLVLAVAAAGALLAAARLRQQVTWTLEGITPPASVLDGWVPMALPLLLLPLLLAVVLPVGPRLPVERLLLQNAPPEVRQRIELPQSEEPEQPSGDPMGEALRRLSGDTVEWPPWLGGLVTWVVWLCALVGLLWVVHRAAQQLAARADREELRGIWAWVGTLASLWVSLLGALGGAARSALAAPAAALEGALSGAGVLGRYLPFVGRAPGEPRAAVRYFFARLEAEARRRGLGRAPGATAGEFGARLRTAVPEEAEAVERVVRAYEAARYSGAPVPASEVGLVRRAWVSIARALGRRRR